MAKVLHRWSQEELDYLRAIAPGKSRTEITEAMSKRFGVEFALTQIVGAMKNHGIRSGRDTRFKRGQVAHNKGKTWDEFMSPEGQAASSKTSFKKGNIPHNTITGTGQERINPDGYIEVHVSEGLQDKPNANWRFKHHIIWEQANGAIPPNTNIVFADGNKRNFDPDNLVAVPRKLWCVIQNQKMDYYDAESLQVCIMRARLASAIHNKRKEIKDER